jgi:hypothetical protein
MRRLCLIASFALALVFFARPGHAQDSTNATLYLFTTGSGEISLYQNGQSLVVGQDYEMTAIPDPGFVFGSWQQMDVFIFSEITIDAEGNPNPPVVSIVGSPTGEYTYQPVLDFTMQPESVIFSNPGVETITQGSGWQANFTPTPEPSTIALVACGLAAIFFRTARR